MMSDFQGFLLNFFACLFHGNIDTEDRQAHLPLEEHTKFVHTHTQRKLVEKGAATAFLCIY